MSLIPLDTPFFMLAKAKLLNQLPSRGQKHHVFCLWSNINSQPVRSVFRLPCRYKDDAFVVESRRLAHAFIRNVPAKGLDGYVLAAYNADSQLVRLARKCVRAPGWDFLISEDNEIRLTATTFPVMFLDEASYDQEHITEDPAYFPPLIQPRNFCPIDNDGLKS